MGKQSVGENSRIVALLEEDHCGFDYRGVGVLDTPITSQEVMKRLRKFHTFSPYYLDAYSCRRVHGDPPRDRSVVIDLVRVIGPVVTPAQLCQILPRFGYQAGGLEELHIMAILWYSFFDGMRVMVVGETVVDQSGKEYCYAIVYNGHKRVVTLHPVDRPIEYLSFDEETGGEVMTYCLVTKPR